MRVVDMLMFAGLVGFACVLWQPESRWRQRALLASGVMALVAGIACVALLHWQAVPASLLAIVLLAGMGFRLLRRGRRGVASGVLAVVIACAVPYYLYPFFEFPEPGGPFAVGTREFELARDVGTEEPRHLLVRVWYPAATSEGFVRRRYYTRDEALLQFPHFQSMHLYDVLTHSRVSAPVRTDGPAFPVVIFNHGYLLYPAQNTALMEHLASHGYVVFSLSHPHDSASYRTLDGLLVRTDPWVPTDELISALKTFVGGATYEKRYEGIEPLRHALAHDRLLRSLENWRADDLFLAGVLSSGTPPSAISDMVVRVDMNTLVYGGMSFGGGAAASTCQSDPRCKAVFSLDGVTWDVSMLGTDLRAPLLLLQTDWMTHPLFPDEPRNPDVNPQDWAFERWATAGERPDIYRYRVLESAHLGMTDLTLIARAPVRASRYGAIDGCRSVAIMNAFTLGFLNAAVRGETRHFPAEVETRFSDVTRHRADGLRTWWGSRNSASAGTR